MVAPVALVPATAAPPQLVPPAAQERRSAAVCADESGAVAKKRQGDALYKEGSFKATVACYRGALASLKAAGGPRAMGCGSMVLVSPRLKGDSGDSSDGGLRLATVLCDDQAAETVDLEYEAARGEARTEDGEEEDDVATSRLLPVYSAEAAMATLHLSLQMSLARCCLRLEQPAEASARANIAVVLAEAARTLAATANRERIAGLAPRPIESGPLCEALHLRAQCHAARSMRQRAEADLAAAAELEP